MAYLVKDQKGYYRLYKKVNGKPYYLKYIGKSKDDAEILLEIVKVRPELLIARSNTQAIAAYKKEKQKLTLATIEPSQINLRLGDFKDLIKELANDSIDLILTDPPYGEQYLHLWGQLAKEGVRILKPSAFLVTYCGQTFLPQVIHSLSEHLAYYWLGMIYHKGGGIAPMYHRHLWNRAKLFLIYQKSPFIEQSDWIEDVIVSPTADKKYHNWGQNVEPFKKLIGHFSLPGQIILDPFAGGGSIIEACIATKRSVIAFEKDKDSYDSIRERFAL